MKVYADQSVVPALWRWHQRQEENVAIRVLDSWSGIGLVAVGMAHQGLQVSLGEHGGHEPLAAEGTAQERTPWRAVQRAAWEALDR
jgi:hypothetical protein